MFYTMFCMDVCFTILRERIKVKINYEVDLACVQFMHNVPTISLWLLSIFKSYNFINLGHHMLSDSTQYDPLFLISNLKIFPTKDSHNTSSRK